MSSTPQYLTGDAKAIDAFLERFDVFLFDCDGVLWSGDEVFPHTVETLTYLRRLDKQLIFVTNNSTKSRADYQAKLARLGIGATVEEIFSSSYSAAVYVSRILQLPPTKRKVFVLGESGIDAELDAEAVPHLGGADPAFRRDITADDYVRIANRDPALLDPEVGAVVVGLDPHVNYLKLSLAYHYITGPNQARFIVTNIDSTVPHAGALFPGAGTTSAPLIRMLADQPPPKSESNNNYNNTTTTTTTAPTAPITLGKPSQALMEAIHNRFAFDRSRACMVGDRLNTDIRFGIHARLGATLAVLTGVTTRHQILAPPTTSEDVQPSAYVDALSDLWTGASRL